MKTQIIRIESHDDAVSVKDKMGWGQTPRILLVWPDRARVINRRLDLVFLKRHSDKLGAQLAFVSEDKLVRYYADRLNIPIYANIRKAEMSHWRPSNRRKRQKTALKLFPTYLSDPDRKPNNNLDELRTWAHPPQIIWLMHPISRLVIFSLGVLAVLSLGAILLPSATIEIQPKITSESVTIPATASTSIQTMSLAGTVPAHRIMITVEGRGTTPSTGSITISDKKAIGEIVFTNLTDHQITVPKGTIVSTLGKDPSRFITMDSAEVAPDSTSNMLPIEALKAGASGNILSNHIIVIEGPLGLDMTVTNPLATSKGTDQAYPSPDEGDFQDLLDNLILELHKTASTELSTQIESDDLILWISPQDYEILEAVYSPEGIQPADQLQLTLRVEYSAFVARGTDLRVLGQSVSETNTEDGFNMVPTTIAIQSVTSPEQVEDGIFAWDLQVGWKAAAVIKEADAVNKILWKSPEDVTQTLSTHLPVESDIKITITPRWWPRMPVLPFRVNLIDNQS